jgi:hypothetical protein
VSLDESTHIPVALPESSPSGGAIITPARYAGRASLVAASRAVIRCLWIAVVIAVLTACANATRERAPSVGEIARAVTPSPAPTTPADVPGKREIKDAVLRSMARLALLKSYRARVVDPAGDTQALFEYIRPDRYRQVTDDKEQIGIGDVAYTRRGDAPWLMEEVPGIGRLANEVTVAQEFFWDVQSRGQETVDGVVCNSYGVVLRLGDTELHDIYWVGVQDNLPHKMITQVDTQTDVIRLLYDFDADFKIEPPVVEPPAQPHD